MPRPLIRSDLLLLSYAIMYISGLATMSCISFLFVVSLPFFLLHPPPAAAAAVAINFFGKFCGSTGNYTANSTYQSNLDTLFSFLASNASASPSGFAATTLGRVPTRSRASPSAAAMSTPPHAAPASASPRRTAPNSALTRRAPHFGMIPAWCNTPTRTFCPRPATRRS
uniref:Uncharacterized protein n=1 Tax=Ananas comosus var. bracteatus TaxID=296719 RepID=A0A6V7QDS4_ANACO|nr:unnamed protein product [Ananas comosus var. bracteatus]